MNSSTVLNEVLLGQHQLCILFLPAMERDLRFVALSRLLIGVVLVATTELVSSPED